MLSFIKNIFKRRPPFEVGDVVKCIDDREWNSGGTNGQLEYLEYYTVQKIAKNCRHGWDVDVGIRFHNQYDHTYCGKCNKEIPGSGIHWATHKRFRLVGKGKRKRIKDYLAKL